MNKLKAALLTLATSLSMTATASHYIFKAANNSKGTQLCMSAVTNDASKLHKQIKNYPVRTQFTDKKMQIIARHQECNGVNIVKFAQQYNADQSTKLLAKHLKKRVLIRQELTTNHPIINKEKPIVILVTGK